MFVRNFRRIVPVIVLAAASVAVADVTPVFFHIDATNASGTASFDVMTDTVSHNTGTGTYSWSTGPIVLANGNTPIATLTSAFVTIIGDPTIGMSFSVVAGSSDTTFNVTTGTLSYGALNPSTGVASAGMTVTESDGNTASITGAGAGGNSYSAFYNGSSIFTSLIPSVVTGVPFGSNTVSGITGPTAIGATTDMTVGYSFTVTANDQASSTSAYTITPEPASLALVAVGLLALRRR
jgi:hypothetical protein